MNSAKILIARADGYLLGVEIGKTMAEVDAYYEGLLKEIKEMEELLKGDTDGKSSREEVNQAGEEG